MTDATADGLISGSSHTASCQLNGMKIFLASSRGNLVSRRASKQTSRFAVRLLSGMQCYAYTADATVLDLDKLASVSIRFRCGMPDATKHRSLQISQVTLHQTIASRRSGQAPHPFV